MKTAAQLDGRAPISRSQKLLSIRRTLAVVRKRERWLKFFIGLTIFVIVGLIVYMIRLAIA